MRSAHLGRGSLANLDPHNSLNLYVYCNNNPVNEVDPSGLEGFRVASDGVSLERRYTLTANLPNRNLQTEFRSPGGGEWYSEQRTVFWDTRSNRQSIVERWFPADETALDVVEHRAFQEWVHRTEAELADSLGKYSVPVKELDHQLEESVWLAEGGWVGRTYVQDITVQGEPFQLVYGPAPRPRGACEPYMRVVGVKWGGSGPGVAQYVAEDVWFDYKKSALTGAAVQTIVEASLITIGEVAALRAAAIPKTVRVYRVEGSVNARLVIGEGGTVAILDGENTLFLNFGSKARAEEYLAQKLNPAQKMGPLPGATIKSFEVRKSVLDELRRTAVTESDLFRNPALKGRPLRVDIRKAPDQFGLRSAQIERLKEFIIQGSGREGL
ncbi:MAG: hypothetical protein KDA90_22715 [Planctomycetaceae bacterium]|nr:hypothetical protein [Planctomycetaceae bacterium]